jgi:AraC-like DNA-binding protein
MPNKRLLLYSFVLILVVLGNFLSMRLSLDVFRSIRWSVISILCFLCLGGSLVLFKRSNGGRARILFASIMLMVGITNFISLFRGLTEGYAGVVEYKFLSLPMLVYGSMSAFMFLLYPIEAYRPGWLTFGRAMRLFLPTFLIPAIYLLVVYIQDASIPIIENRTAFGRQFWSMGVWVSLLILMYPIFGLIIMLRYRSQYKSWCENNYASMEEIDVRWLDDYIFSNFVFTLSSLVVVFSNDVRSVLMHNIIFLLFFIYGFYRVLFQKNPYPEGYFKAGMDVALESIETNPTVQESYPSTLLAHKLPEYKVKVEKWMQIDKPYLRKDLKLTDVMDIVPLNRSYLSRVFNEGFGETFYQYVMRHRIEESKRLLISRPELSIAHIAELSGFSSPSVFSRAFIQATTYSPTQWRKNEQTCTPTLNP